MHPVEEDSRFVINSVYPDRQALLCRRRGARKNQPSLQRAGKEVPFPAGVNYLESWDLTPQKNERRWFMKAATKRPTRLC
ncbi:hypothetical protein MTP99_002015 [Tenebrio molitor]|jgi:hypothetical protein|nr:hypothetical protein MTP99_002015 [Tenebrio molitor]